MTVNYLPMNIVLNSLKGLINKEISVETKKRRLLRAACITWFCVLAMFTIKNTLAQNEGYALGMLVNGITVLVILAIFFIDLKGHSVLARYLVTFALTASIINSAFFLFPGTNTELFLLIIGPFSVFFIRRSWVQVFIFSIAFGSFLFLPGLLNIHSDVSEIFNLKIVFITVFFIIKDVDGVNKKTEKSLFNQKQKAEKDKELIELQKQKLDELNDFKNRFFVNIAHELRTPLTLINGLASQLDKQTSTRLTSGILDQSDKMKKIVDDILDLSKLDSDSLKLTTEEVELDKFLNKLHQAFLPSFLQKELTFDFLPSNQHLTASIDPVYFERALNNILLNALKFTEKGGVKLSLVANDTTATIQIKDTGIGMNMEEQSKIFTEFFQADNDINRAGGTGVGLSFTKSILTLHGGTVDVQSDPETGSSFSVKIPIKHGQESLKKRDLVEIDTLTPQKISKGKKILVVEDHVEMREYIVSLLEDYETIQAGNGKEALEILDVDKVDFILTDYMMPKMDGYEFVKIIKEKNVSVPILMLTARADTQAKLKVLRLGIDDYLTKPFHPEEMLTRIENGIKNYTERIEYSLEATDAQFEEGFALELSQFVEKNCAEHDFNLDKVKEEFALSTSTLYRKVKVETGLSPIEFVKEIRLQKARREIEKDGNISMKMLSISVGITNTTYFKNQYLARFGLDPSKR